jgi:hypothetical protein
MSRLRFAFVILACLGLLAPAAASAQQAAPAGYTYVAEWDAPRDKWIEIAAFAEKVWRPMLERLLADGTITGFGVYESVVHEPDGISHGLWWSAASMAGVEKARTEALKLPPAPGLMTAKHRDYFLRSLVWKGKPAKGAGGYLRVATSVVQPGKAEEWQALWEKYNQPTYDELVANGTLSAYGVQLEQVVTADPGVRMVVSLYPNAEAMDKTQAAFSAASAQRTQQERESVTAAFAKATVPGSFRSYLAHVSVFSMK